MEEKDNKPKGGAAVQSATPKILGPCPEYPSGGWPDYGVCMKTCQPPGYICVQVLASDPAMWQCSC